MRLIIKDFLSQLKEKDELDFLLCDVLFQMGYTTENKPRTGVRQYGVDIRAHKEEEILLCVIKQGNLNRSNWNDGQNAVRQSLDEIHDCYLTQIVGQDRNKRLHIVVASNGMIDEAVRPNWEGYRNQNTNWDGISVILDFWNIDKITELVQKNLCNEYLFDSKIQTLLRRSLYFIDEGNYINKYYEQVIDTLFAEINKSDSIKIIKKKISTVHLACQMIAHFAAEKKLYKYSVSVSEYLIIRYWKYIVENDVFEKPMYIERLVLFIADYDKWSYKYYESIKYYCEVENRIPLYNIVEQRVVLYEVLGYLVTYAYYLSYERKTSKTTQQKFNEVLDCIIKLINSYPQWKYPPYDMNVNIISMLYRLLDRAGRTKEVLILLERQVYTLVFYYTLFKKYPSPVDSFEDAINIDMGFQSADYDCSAFWGNIMQWLVVLEQDEMYNNIQSFLSSSLANVTKCTWFLRASDELKLYDRYAMNSTGDCFSIDPVGSFDELKETVKFVMEQYSNEKFSFDEYCFESLEFIICRYYGYLARVKREEV